MSDSTKRVFTVSDADQQTVDGNTPRHAALKAARRLGREDEEITSEAEAKARPDEIRLREADSDKVHVYTAWTWNDEAPEDHPSWLGETITKANVKKEGIEFE